MIGYISRVFKLSAFDNFSSILVSLRPAPSELQEVVVHPLVAQEIVRRAVQKIQSLISPVDFQSTSSRV
jgi:hypothetical protein